MNASQQELSLAALPAGSCRGATILRIAAGVGLTILVALSAARAQEATRQTPRNSMERSDFATAPAHDCAMQLRNFIQALDQLIDTSPNICPLLRLLKQYFPVKKLQHSRSDRDLQAIKIFR